MRRGFVGFIGCGLLSMLAQSAVCGEIRIEGRRFTVPDGFVVERVTTPALVKRPISGAFDERGRLYVSDSSGTNDNVRKQLAERPHRILRLADVNGDGVFDRSHVFADKMMFPEGTLWHAGSLYVAAPPQIWKLTDTDEDGVADRREVWFDGKTLTGCANDLHGPYLGPDGWIYWCKGAFAKQTHARVSGDRLVTRAAHIFRRRPEGGPLEVVMTGGMDNPVDVVFTRGGERIFSTTFLVHPSNGLRDGLIHAIYGGVYGKAHGVLEGHARTGALMPPLVHLGAAAPCGLVRLAGEGMGASYRTNLLACLFNMHRVKRVQLDRRGARLVAKASDFLACDDLNFHPTDVLEDADGSVLVVDTGGWYKLCCPTSQLHKPDILGAIYRVRRRGARRAGDHWGAKLQWKRASNQELAARLSDARHMVRRRAAAALAVRGRASAPVLRAAYDASVSAAVRCRLVWVASRVRGDAASALVRRALEDDNETVRQAALHAVSVNRDREAVSAVERVLLSNSDFNRRAAAEALGRIGGDGSATALLTAAKSGADRVLEHSLIYALIELNRPEPVRKRLRDRESRVRRAALIALDQMSAGKLEPHHFSGLLDSRDEVLRRTAWWLAERHPEWAAHYGEYFRDALGGGEEGAAESPKFVSRLAMFLGDAAVQKIAIAALERRPASDSIRRAVLRAVAASRIAKLDARWSAAIYRHWEAGEPELEAAAISASQKALPLGGLQRIRLLRHVAANKRLDPRAKILAFRQADADARFDLLIRYVGSEHRAPLRALAVDELAKLRLSAGQVERLLGLVSEVGPAELRHLLAQLAKVRQPRRDWGAKLLDRLGRSAAVSSVELTSLEKVLTHFGADRAGIQALLKRVRVENAGKLQRLEALLGRLSEGDIRRGQRVFQSAKAACSACHQMGYLGGRVGPDLTRIGRIRSARDLLEAVLFPSASFVRSYEPTTIVTTDGRVLQGLIQAESAVEVRLVVDAQKTIVLKRSQIAERREGRVSVMPTGLEKQLSEQQLLDLVVYLRSRR